MVGVEWRVEEKLKPKKKRPASGQAVLRTPSSTYLSGVVALWRLRGGRRGR